MDINRTKFVLKTLLEDNQDLLVSSLIHQGQQRRIAQITTSTLTPLNEYYFIGISCPRCRSYSKPGVSNVAKPAAWNDYLIRLEIYDEASIQLGDDQAYETMTADFDRLADRIEALLRTQNFFGGTRMILKPAPGSSETSRVINRADLSGNWQDTERTQVAWLYAQLEFILTEQCDDSSLYD